jgi:hypothetical protein
MIAVKTNSLNNISNNYKLKTTNILVVARNIQVKELKNRNNSNSVRIRNLIRTCSSAIHLKGLKPRKSLMADDSRSLIVVSIVAVVALVVLFLARGATPTYTGAVSRGDLRACQDAFSSCIEKENRDMCGTNYTGSGQADINPSPGCVADGLYCVQQYQLCAGLAKGKY